MNYRVHTGRTCLILECRSHPQGLVEVPLGSASMLHPRNRTNSATRRSWHLGLPGQLTLVAEINQKARGAPRSSNVTRVYLVRLPMSNTASTNSVDKRERP